MNIQIYNDILLIINPNSGHKNANSLIQFVKKNVPDLDFFIPENGDEATILLEDKIERYSVFILAGGDGTINRALPFFLGRKDKILCIFPLGSGNGFAREMGFTTDFVQLLSHIQKRESLSVDVVKINDHYSINVAGIGLDGYIAHLFSREKTRGLMKYVFLTLKSLFSYRPFTSTVQVNGHIYQGSFLGISIANNRQFGNNAYIAPEAIPNDGLFDIIMIRPFPFYYYPIFFYKLFAGTLTANKYLIIQQSNNQAEIKTNYQFAHVDGESVICKGNVLIEMIPQTVQILKTKKTELL
ncbi:MAG: hypothetical protein IPN49_05865 [Saprospiraceae bacterium]|nr:hypothetical protein [Saprospiraceae bacterium]